MGLERNFGQNQTKLMECHAMNAPVTAVTQLEPRPLYGIGTVARLTGLKPDTLRVWERRYGLGASNKSAWVYWRRPDADL